MKCKLEDIALVTMGQSPKGETYNTTGEGMPFLQGNRTFGDRYPTFDTWTSSPTKIAEAGDVIMSVRAPVGDLNITPVQMCLGRGVCSIRANNGCQDYIYYLMKYSMSQLLAKESGTVFGSVNRNDINGLEVYVPDTLAEQEKIARYLSAIDEKIENNKQINNNLLEQAKSIFKDKFVDLSPFDGQLPDNWKIGTVSEIIELHDSKRIPLSSRERAELDKIYPYYGATSVMDYVDKYLFDGIYLLLGEDGTVIDANGFPILQYVEGKFWVNNHAHILTGKNGFSVELLYLLFSLTNVASIVTGAVQPKISQGNLNNVSIVIPSQVELQKMDDIIQPMFAQIRTLRAENERLANIRDSLLPKLMSGELDVSDIQL